MSEKFCWACGGDEMIDRYDETLDVKGVTCPFCADAYLGDIIQHDPETGEYVCADCEKRWKPELREWRQYDATQPKLMEVG